VHVSAIPTEQYVSVDWIAVDWGTSNLRAWAIGRDGGVAHDASSASGMAKLTREEFEPALLALIGNWLPAGRKTLVIACGMVGARQGWIEVPYNEAPCPPASAQSARSPQTKDARLDVRIIAGVMQREPADVMRGEETQIAGLLQKTPDFGGVICMPGTHTKWVRVKDGKIAEFKSCMTGEVFGLLAEQSVLRFSVKGDGSGNAWDDEEYAEAVRAGLERPEGFAGALFSIRAASLIAGLPQAAANARLSGLTIGIELAATRAYWNSDSVSIVDNGRQAALYAAALKIAGGATALLAAQDVTLAGLRAAHANFMRETT
jgi:2-dehydro-3-deoxygalactonokinase